MNSSEARRQRHTAHSARLNSGMLVLGREARGVSQTQMARDLLWSQGRLSKYENGLLGVSTDDLDRIAAYLDYPREFFLQVDQPIGFATCCLYHRKKQSVPVRVLNALHAQVNILKIQIARFLRSAELDSPYHFPRLDIDEYDGCPETVARLARACWQLPFGPVRDLVLTIESAGGIVVECDFGTAKLDAVSLWPQGMPPLFFVNNGTPIDRRRWTLAHEVGHIIMHTIPSRDAEREADRFASEFLMPERTIKGDLKGMSIQKAARLKPKWRVSMQSIIRRAYDVGVVTERQYRRLYQRISQLGFRKNEPVELEPETPCVLRQIINLHLQDYGYDVAQLSKLALSTEDNFRRQFLSQDLPFRVVG